MACNTSLVMRAFFAGFGMGMWANQLEKDLDSGDTALVIFDLMQAASLIGSFCSKCFTGDTLIAAEQGLTRIDEVKAGDYVLAENVETGEKEYKKVLKVYVKEATELVHLKTDGTKDEDQTIDTTANHPFYVDGKGWVAAVNLEEGDKLHTNSGEVVEITGKTIEKLKHPIKVYNLEVEDFHTYYVTGDEVLVHNEYSSSSIDNLVNKIPSKYKENLMCKEFANGLERLMKINNVHGKRIFLESGTDYIVSNKYGVISYNGTHDAIKIGDTVYDNLNPKGVGYNEWLFDLGITECPSMFKISIKLIGEKNEY